MKILHHNTSTFVIGIVMLMAIPAFAQTTVSWDTNGATGGSSGGTTAPGTWNNGTTADWTTSIGGTTGTSVWSAVAAGSKNATFSAGANATGAFTITVTGTVTNVGGLTFQEGTVTLAEGASGLLNLTGAATFNVAATQAIVAANIGSTGSFNKTGTGELDLSGANTFTGGSTVTAGTLGFGSATAVGTGTLTLAGGTIQAVTAARTLTNAVTVSGDFTVGGTNNLTLSGATALGAATRNITVNNTGLTTLSGIVSSSGTAGLGKAGSGTLVLSGANTFTGNINITAGTLSVAADGNLGNAANGVTLNGGTLQSTGTFTAGASRVVTTGASGGNIDVSAGQTLTLGAAGQLAGSGDLTKTSTGTLVLSGANTYTGATAINSGIISIQNGDALGNAANTANTTVASGASLQMANNITTTNAGTLVLNGAGTGSGALQNVSGNNSWNSNVALASNATIYSSTAGNVLTLGNASGTSLFTMGSNTVTIDGPGDTFINSNVGVSGDTGGLIKNGTGTLTLYGYDTYYTGATVVNGGSMDLLVGPFNAGIYGINGSLTIGTGPSNAALAGTVNVNIATNSYNNQLSPTSAVTINSDGALNVGSSTGLGSLTLNGGQVNITSGVVISPSGNVTSNANSAHETSLISGGQVNLGSPTVFTVARDSTITSDLTVSSVLAGTSLVKQGAGVLTLAGTAANTYTGGTSINDGTIALNMTAGTNALGTGAVTVGDGIGAASSANLSLLANNQTSNTAAVTLNSDGRLGLNNLSTSINTIGGTGLIDLATSGSLTVGANNGSSSFGGSITGTGTLTKSGSGTLSLTSNIGFGGTFVLSGGTLQLGGTTLTLGTLDITGISVIDFAGAAASLSVSNLFIQAGSTLTILNWQNSVDFFTAANWTGATYNVMGSDPMDYVTFSGNSASVTGWDSYDNQVRPNVPEPSAYGAALLLLVSVFTGLRKRLSAKRFLMRICA